MWFASSGPVLDPGAFSRDGRGMLMLRTGQRSSLGPFATKRRKRREGSWTGDAGRRHGICVGVESSEIGRVSAAWFWFDFILSRDDHSCRVRKGSRIRPLSSFSPSNASVRDIIESHPIATKNFFQKECLIHDFKETRISYLFTIDLIHTNLLQYN